MPLPMVHLSVAQLLVQDHDWLASPEFYLGSIAPDAIHMRPGTGPQDKQSVHLFGENGLDLDRLRALLAAGEGSRKRSNGRGFATGYAVHILTDAAWRENVLLAFRRRFLEQMSYPELRALYYSECDRLDLDLYDEQPWRPEVWELLRAAEAQDVGLGKGAPLLTADEVDAWRARTLVWFDGHREKANYQPQYLTRDQVCPFIPETAARIAAQMADLRPHL